MTPAAKNLLPLFDGLSWKTLEKRPKYPHMTGGKMCGLLRPQELVSFVSIHFVCLYCTHGKEKTGELNMKNAGLGVEFASKVSKKNRLFRNYAGNWGKFQI